MSELEDSAMETIKTEVGIEKEIKKKTNLKY